MPRSSSHKSQRPHKRSSRDATERSESEDDGSSRKRRLRLVEAGPVSGARVSRDVEAEKRKDSSLRQVSMEKVKVWSENGDFSSGTKRKEREEDSATPDRWNGSGKDDALPEKGSKEEAFGHANLEKMDKSRLLTVESKCRSTGRREGSTERYVESGNRTESIKRRMEKEHARGDYRDDKESGIDRISGRDKDRECAPERSNKVQDSRHGRSDDVESKSQRPKRGASEMEWKAKKDTESQVRDDLGNAESEKDPEKVMTKRRCNSGGIDKVLDDSRNSDDRRLSSRDDHLKNGSHKSNVHKDERYKNDKYRDKYYMDQRHRDVRHREERSSRDYINGRLGSKSLRDRDNHFESNKKSRLHGSDREHSPHADDHGIKSRANRLQKRSYDEIDDNHGLINISSKASHFESNKKSRLHGSDGEHSPHADDHGIKSRANRLQKRSYDEIDDNHGLRNISSKASHFESNKKSRLHGSDREHSPHADDHGIKSRANRLRKRTYDEIDDNHALRNISSKASRFNIDKDALSSSKFDNNGHQCKVDSSLNTHSRSSLSPKAKMQIRRGLNQAECTRGEPPRDDGACLIENHDRVSVVQERVSQSVSTEKVQRRDRVNSDNRDRNSVFASPITANNSQADSKIAECASASPSPFKRPSQFSGSSPAHLNPRPLKRHGTGNPSTNGDRRSISMEQGQGWAWKNGQNWPALLPNGFVPFPHGPRAPGFNIQRSPHPSLFGTRPYMDMNQTGIPYHPFGWHCPVDNSCPPYMRGWDGGNSLLGDRSQVYRGPDWNRNNHLLGGRGWESNSEMSKGHSSSMADFSSPQVLPDESRGSHPSMESNSKVEHFQHASDATPHVKQLNDPPVNKSKEKHRDKLASQFKKNLSGDRSKILDGDRTKILNGDRHNLCNSYLSKIDISEELVHPELYKKVRDLLASDNSSGICNVSKDEDAKKNKNQNSVKFSELKSHLPQAAAGAAFKRAMLVYEKQSCRRKLKPPAVAVCSEEVNASLNVTAEDGERPAGSSRAGETSVVDMEITATNTSSSGDAEGSLVHMEVQNVENPGANMKMQSDLNSDVDILEISRTCETIMSVCKAMK